MPEKIKIKDLLPHASSTPAIVKQEDSLEKVINSMIDDPQTENVYVTDNQGIIIGTISLKTVLQRICIDCLPARSSPYNVLEFISSETAKDLMTENPVYATPEDDLRSVLEKMLRIDVLEIPVVDEKRKVIGNLKVMEFIWPWIHADLE